MLDPPGPHIVFVNAAFERMTGWSAAELKTLTPRIMQGPETDRETLQRLRACLIAGEPFQGSAVNYRRDGSPFVNEWSISPVKDERGAPKYFVAVQRDITTFRRRLAEAEAGARTDALTGLANRRGYDVRLAAALAQPDIVLGLLAIDIDHFKSVNDTHGHGADDAVLVEVSRRMAAVAAGDQRRSIERRGRPRAVSRQERGAQPGGTGAGARGLRMRTALERWRLLHRSNVPLDDAGMVRRFWSHVSPRDPLSTPTSATRVP